ncbi:MAG: trypsin-like serine protease [Myxococcota bacterium]
MLTFIQLRPAILLGMIAVIPAHALATCPSTTASETARGLTRVDHGDGTFSYALPSGASTSTQVGNLMTWQYDGQQSFPCVNVPLEAHIAEGDEEAEDPSEGADSLLGAIRIDRLGRRWKVTSLDWVAFNYDVADYWADVDATIGLDLDPIGTPEFQDMDEEENSDWTIIPFSNSSSYVKTSTCPGGNSVLVWGGTDERSNESLTGLNAKYSGFVSVDVGSTTDICGGALISDRVAVTAAHCVRGESDVKVKTVSGATIGVEIILNPKYAGSLGSNSTTGKQFHKKSSRQHDWAILVLESSVSDTPMKFSKDGVVAV